MRSKQKKTQVCTIKRMTDSKVCGIDYSITSPAFTIYDGTNFNTYFMVGNSRDCDHARKTSPYLNPKIYPKYDTQEERHYRLAEWVLDELMWQHRPPCLIENYAYGARGRVFNIGENTGTLKHMLWKEGIPFEVDTPQKIKKFATGKGNASKLDMFDAFVMETKLDLEGVKQWSDIADSYWISRYYYSIKARH